MNEIAMPTRSAPMLRRLALVLGAWLSLTAMAMEPDAEAGRRLYQEGVLASGESLVGLGFGDAELHGDFAACMRCHRKSGFGSYEGGYYIPPITEPYMFGGRQISRDDRFRALFMQAQTAEFRHQVRRVRDRPPYDLESLGQVLASGVDTGGRQLETLMPRYRLSDQDLANLHAYLQTLSAQISPGVGEKYVELATIIHAGVAPQRRRAMLETMESFVDWYNTRTLGDLQLAGHSVYGSSLYTRYARLYRLNVWEIDGPPDTWPAQLETHYRESPVFAVVSGQVSGPWAPVHGFLDRNRIPAVFPITDLPHSADPVGGYTVYFNGGLLLEAELMHQWLVRNARGRVVQIHGQQAESSEPARRLAELAARPGAGLNLDTISEARWRALDRTEVPVFDTLVVWDSNPDAAQLERWRVATGARLILLPAAALEPVVASVGESIAPPARPALVDALRFSRTRPLVDEYYPERFRAQAWMNTRGLDFVASDVQFETWYAMMMFRDSFMHLLDHYHRDYLIEVLEHQIQGSPNPGLYPDMALAPRQRFASKSGYIVGLDPETLGPVAVGGRMVP